MRAKFKVLLGERLCEKAFGVNLGEFNGLKSAFACEFDSHENAVASQKGALMSAFKTHLSELKRAFASHKGTFLDKCQKGEFESKRVKKKLWRRNFSLSLSR